MRTGDLAVALSAALGVPVDVVYRTALGGGSVSHVEKIDTSAGPFVLKWMTGAPSGFFAAEAAGLAALRAAGSGFTIPHVIASSGPDERRDAPAYLILEWLAPGSGGGDVDERAGHALAALHQTSAAQYGFDHDTFCGTTRQPNARLSSWVSFFATARLGHMGDLAGRDGLLGTGDRQQLDRVIARLDSWLIEPPDGPVLIHGDLWSGNFHRTTSGPALIDPAVYYAHREAELGIMTLFGGVPARLLAAYDEALPLDTGWRERLPLYQIYHLLNHLALFGGGYRGQAMAIVRRYA